MPNGKSISWERALDQLRKGNERFTSGLRSTESLSGHLRLKELATTGQSPFAIVLSCSDSRVPSELLFDCGFGDLFVVRVAGNVVQPNQIASIEFAAKVLGAELCVVMGHSKCGAVHAAIQSEMKKQPSISPNIDALIQLIRPSVHRCLSKVKEESPEEILDLSIRENVHSTVKEILEKSPLLREFTRDGKFAVVEAHFSLETGQVEFGATSAT